MSAGIQPLTAGVPTAGLRSKRLVRLAYWRDPALHLVLIVVGYRLAYELRFDFGTPPEEAPH